MSEYLTKHLLVQQVLRIRRGQRRVGTRKLLLLMAAFMAEHGIRMGRDTFFELLRQRGLCLAVTY